MSKHHDTVTVFAQGNGASRAQAAKYTTEGVMIHKRSVQYAHANPVVHNVWESAEMRDIGYGWSWWPLHWLFLAVSWLHFWWHGVEGAEPHYVRVTRLSVAGDDDVAQYQEALRDAMRHEPQKRIVAFGTSKGAATVLVAVATLEADEQARIALVVAEAPFDTLPNVMRLRFGAAAPLLYWLLRTLALVRHDQLSPLQAVARLPLTLPLVFVSSEADTVVRPLLTRNLVDALLKRGHRDVHHLVLRDSPHGAMSLGRGTDQHFYVEFMAQMYTRYVE